MMGFPLLLEENPTAPVNNTLHMNTLHLNSL